MPRRPAAISIPHRQGLPVHVQGLDELTGGQHIERPLVEGIETAQVRMVRRAAQTIKAIQQLAPGHELLLREIAQLHDGHVFTIHFDGTVAPAEQSWSRAVVRLVLHRREQIDKRRDDAIDRSLDPGDHRAEAWLAFPLTDPHGVAGYVLKTAMFIAQSDKG